MSDLKPEFWKNRTLESFNPQEWEALCDGCGKCCLNKLEDWDTGEIHWTNLSCVLLDCDSCQCSNYENRFDHVPDCVQLTPETVRKVSWLPKTCAYRLVKEGADLPKWHYLKTGDKKSVIDANASVKGKCLSEQGITLEQYEDHLVDIENL